MHITLERLAVGVHDAFGFLDGEGGYAARFSGLNDLVGGGEGGHEDQIARESPRHLLDEELIHPQPIGTIRMRQQMMDHVIDLEIRETK